MPIQSDQQIAASRARYQKLAALGIALRAREEAREEVERRTLAVYRLLDDLRGLQASDEEIDNVYNANHLIELRPKEEPCDPT